MWFYITTSLGFTKRPITANKSFVTHDYTHDTRCPWGVITREKFMRLNYDTTTKSAQTSYMQREKLIYLLFILICRQIMQVVFGMLGWQCRTAEVKCRCHNRAGYLVPKQVRIWSEALANPQVEGVRAAGRATGASTETKVILCVNASLLNKRRRISLRDSDPVISPATAPPSPANHQHCAVPVRPVAPEADLVPGLNVAITLGLLKPVRVAVLSAILHVAAAKTFVTGPHFSIPEVAVTCEFRAERLSRQAVGCGLQQSCVAGVVASSNLELRSFDGPEGRGDHICVVSWICSLTNRRSSVVPILAVVLHPILSVVVGEPGHQSPALVVACHVAEDLIQKEKKCHIMSNYNRGRCCCFCWRNDVLDKTQYMETSYSLETLYRQWCPRSSHPLVRLYWQSLHMIVRFLQQQCSKCRSSHNWDITKIHLMHYILRSSLPGRTMSEVDVRISPSLFWEVHV